MDMLDDVVDDSKTVAAVGRARSRWDWIQIAERDGVPWLGGDSAGGNNGGDIGMAVEDDLVI